jgi:signal transduction histidine kinase
MRSGLPRGPGILLVWLALALAASMILAVQAVAAWRSHRQATESVLSDYARLAAREMKDRLDFRFAVYTCGAIARFATALERLPSEEPIPAPGDLAADASETLRTAIAHVRAIHCWDFDRGGFRGEAPENAQGIVSLVERESRSGADQERGWLYAPAVSGGSVVRVVRDEDGAPRRAWVFLLDGERVAATIRGIAGIGPLLPDFLIRSEDAAQWLGWWVLAPAQGEMASAGAVAPAGDEPYAPRSWIAEEETGALLGGMVVRVRILPEAAAFLVSGGVPRSNVALTAALVLLSGGLLVGAYRQVRREAELARLREDFLAGISHELRTPLAQIRMFAETLRLGRVRSEEEGERSLEILVRESQRLSHLVENVLVDSRAMRGVLSASRRRCDISRRLGEVADEFQPLAGVRGARIRKRIEPGLVGEVDEELLRQAVLNLLDNAVKYGPRGQTVTVGARRSGTDLRIEVEDEGPGIPRADRARAGTRFFRLARDRDGAVAGSGIGLAVVRDVAALHEGRLEIEDTDGAGVRMVIRLPGGGEA